jgi:hypothetical protein
MIAVKAALSLTRGRPVVCVGRSGGSSLTSFQSPRRPTTNESGTSPAEVV